MDTIAGIGLILSLIPLYQREGDKRSQTSKEDFFAWLVEHRFQEVKDCITANFTLADEIDSLLKLNQKELLARFDKLDTRILQLLEGMEEFKSLAVAVGGKKISLSPQAINILRQYVDSGRTYLCAGQFGSEVVVMAENLGIEVDKPRFILSDVATLEQAGYIQYVDTINGGIKKFSLTNEGEAFIASLQKQD